MAIDYKLLLEKYIKHVAMEEGTDFIYSFGEVASDYNGITKEEWEELIKISEKRG